MGALINTSFSETVKLPLPPPTGPQPHIRLVQVVMGSLDEAKAVDTILIDLFGKTSIADAMLVTTGRSNVHVTAIADRIVRSIKDNGLGIPRVEGLPNGDWVLIDAGDIIVHVFRPEVRQFYNLEKMWGVDRPKPEAAYY